MLISPSREGLERFVEATAKSDPEQPGAAFGADVLSLTFHNATPIAGDDAPRGDAAPLARRRRSRAQRLPPKARCDLQGRHLRTGLRVAYFDDEDREVRFAAPTRRSTSSTSTRPRIRTAAPDIGSGGRPSPPPVRNGGAHAAWGSLGVPVPS